MPETDAIQNQLSKITEGIMARTVSVVSGPRRYAQSIYIGAHVLQADEPADVGGKDAGPDSVELLMAALGACTGITAQMYAERKQWNLQSVHVDVSYERVLAADSAASGAKIGMVDQLAMQISLSGDLSQEQRSRLFEIANHCPVHRMLTSEVKIHSELLIPDASPQ
jgi:putative redox protein